MYNVIYTTGPIVADSAILRPCGSAEVIHMEADKPASIESKFC